MISKKRKKSTRHRGSNTHSRGGMKKARGKGHRGGKGMAGTGKRADQRKTKILNMSESYFGKSKTLRRKKQEKLKYINIKKIINDIPSMLKTNQANEIKNEIHINLKGYKILSNGEVKDKLIITTTAISKKAEEKIKKAGGKILIQKKKKNSEKTIKEK